MHSLFFHLAVQLNNKDKMTKNGKENGRGGISRQVTLNNFWGTKIRGTQSRAHTSLEYALRRVQSRKNLVMTRENNSVPWIRKVPAKGQLSSQPPWSQARHLSSTFHTPHVESSQCASYFSALKNVFKNQTSEESPYPFLIPLPMYLLLGENTSNN